MEGDHTNFRISQDSYSPQDLELRDQFVRYYMLNYDAYGSCIRLGFEPEAAFELSKEYMSDPYVLTSITKAENARQGVKSDENDLSVLPNGFVPHDEETDKQRIKSALFKEGFFRGPGSSHAARVAALKTLAQIYELDKEEKKVEKVASNVMVVPAMGSVDSWEQSASEQQEKLKRTVRE